MYEYGFSSTYIFLFFVQSILFRFQCESRLFSLIYFLYHLFFCCCQVKESYLAEQQLTHSWLIQKRLFCFHSSTYTHNRFIVRKWSGLFSLLLTFDSTFVSFFVLNSEALSLLLWKLCIFGWIGGNWPNFPNSSRWFWDAICLFVFFFTHSVFYLSPFHTQITNIAWAYFFQMVLKTMVRKCTNSHSSSTLLLHIALTTYE